MHRNKTRILLSITSALRLTCAGTARRQAASAPDRSDGRLQRHPGRRRCSGSPKSRPIGTARWCSSGHGFPTTLVAQDAPSQGSAAQLLAQGYALLGSSYDVSNSWWALDTAVSDQFGSLTAFTATSGLHPRRTLAVGQSMGGLINSLIDQQADGRVQGAVTFCGPGRPAAADLNDFQLNSEAAMTELAPGATAGADPRLRLDPAARKRGQDLQPSSSDHRGRSPRPPAGAHRARRHAARLKSDLDHFGRRARLARGYTRPGNPGGGDAPPADNCRSSSPAGT